MPSVPRLISTVGIAGIGIVTGGITLGRAAGGVVLSIEIELDLDVEVGAGATIEAEGEGVTAGMIVVKVEVTSGMRVDVDATLGMLIITALAVGVKSIDARMEELDAEESAAGMETAEGRGMKVVVTITDVEVSVTITTTGP